MFFNGCHKTFVCGMKGCYGKDFLRFFPLIGGRFVHEEVLPTVESSLMVGSIQENSGIASCQEKINELCNVVCWATADATYAQKLAVRGTFPAMGRVA